MKSCSNKNCKQINPQSLENYYRNKNYPDGLQYRCKSCYRSDKQNPDYKKYEKQFNKENHIKNKLNSSFIEKRKEYKKTLEYKKSCKKTSLKRLYNLTLESYNILLKNQNYCCAICFGQEIAIDKRTNQPRSLAVDHCHKTKKIRGLLCSRCNRGIGSLQDNQEIIYRAYKYLKINNNEVC